MGSRKIEMKIVKDSSSRQATFSKRKAGLFKKANKLAILCGAQVAIVAFSPGGKPYSFGSPSVQTVVHRFLSDQQKTSSELKRVNIKPVDEMNLDEVQEMKAALLELKEKIKRRAAEMEASSSDAKDKN